MQKPAGSPPQSADSLPLGTPPVLVIVDAGVATAANVKLLAKAHFHYLVNDSRRGRKKWQAEFAQDALFQPVSGREHKSQVRIRSLDIKSGERLVLCKSEGRREKELAIRSGAETRFLGRPWQFRGVREMTFLRWRSKEGPCSRQQSGLISRRE